MRRITYHRAASRGCNSVIAMKIQRSVEKSNDMTCATGGRKKSLSRTSASSAYGCPIKAHVRFWHKADIAAVAFRFSNRPVGVKRFQAVQRCSVDVARGLAVRRAGRYA